MRKMAAKLLLIQCTRYDKVIVPACCMFSDGSGSGIRAREHGQMAR
jgi:hypothetical protein